MCVLRDLSVFCDRFLGETVKPFKIGKIVLIVECFAASELQLLLLSGYDNVIMHHQGR